MKHAVYNSFKYEKKLKQLERKKQRDNKRKAIVIYEMLENNKQNSFSANQLRNLKMKKLTDVQIYMLAKNTNILDKQNKYMIASLLKAKNESEGSKRNFVRLAKKYNGLLKSNDPIILECLKQWF